MARERSKKPVDKPDKRKDLFDRIDSDLAKIDDVLEGGIDGRGGTYEPNVGDGGT